MSHSTSDEEREWDYEARDSDWVAFVHCEKKGERPEDWQASEIVNVVSYKELRKEENNTKEKSKGPTQGSELTKTWPTAVPSSDGKVKEITQGENGRILISRKEDGRTLPYSLKKKVGDEEYASLSPQVEEGTEVRGRSEIIASSVNLIGEDNLACDNNYSVPQYLEDLENDSFTDKFTAIRALGFLKDDKGISELLDLQGDEKQNYFLRLESAISLAKHGIEEGWDFLENTLTYAEEDGLTKYANRRLEAVIALGEINSERAAENLQTILSDKEELEEIRAEAANSLRKIGNADFAETLIRSFECPSRKIRKDSINALAEIINENKEKLIEGLKSGSDDIKLGCSIVLAKLGLNTYKDILSTAGNEISFEWLSLSASLLPRDDLSSLEEMLKELNPRIYHSANLMSKFFNSWADELSSDIRYELKR